MPRVVYVPDCLCRWGVGKEDCARHQKSCEFYDNNPTSTCNRETLYIVQYVDNRGYFHGFRRLCNVHRPHQDKKDAKRLAPA